MTNKKAWTIEEDDFIIKHPDMDAAEIAKQLNRTKAAVRTKRQRLYNFESVRISQKKYNNFTPKEKWAMVNIMLNALKRCKGIETVPAEQNPFGTFKIKIKKCDGKLVFEQADT